MVLLFLTYHLPGISQSGAFLVGFLSLIDVIPTVFGMADQLNSLLVNNILLSRDAIVHFTTQLLKNILMHPSSNIHK